MSQNEDHIKGEDADPSRTLDGGPPPARAGQSHWRLQAAWGESDHEESHHPLDVLLVSHGLSICFFFVGICDTSMAGLTMT